MTAGTGQRPGGRPRNRALCCDCGQLRTVAQFYRGRTPGHIRPREVGDHPWCAWLRCGHCRRVTLHAVIADSLAQRWRTEGCDRERHDRLTDRCRRRIERRLAALVAEGVTVVRAMSTDDMQVEDAPVEVVEYADARGLQIRICATATPVQLLRVVEAAEDVIDDPTKLGDWQSATDGRWRGLALRA